MDRSEMAFYVDPSRCIGCQACVHACAECGTHRGRSMIHLEVVDRSASTQTVPTVCMHCEEPACAIACPTDAIKKAPDGVVQSADPARCIGCGNCVLACPFGVPEVHADVDLMMKCDMCHDRTSAGLRPMCVTGGPSGARAYGPREEIARRRAAAVRVFRVGPGVVETRVYAVVVPPAGVWASAAGAAGGGT